MRSSPSSGTRRRQLRLRVIEALEQRVKQFIRREELWPLRIPREPLLLAEVVEQVLQEDARSFDVATLRSRPLLHLEWDDGSTWDAWVIGLPSGLKLYCDSSNEEDRILASGGRNDGEDSDRAFLELLAESAGRHFGIEMAGGAPARVRAAIGSREFLVELFVNLFEVAGTEASVREQIDRPKRAGPDGAAVDSSDFRADVERWLERAVTSSPSPSLPS